MQLVIPLRSTELQKKLANKGKTTLSTQPSKDKDGNAITSNSLISGPNFWKRNLQQKKMSLKLFCTLKMKKMCHRHH